MISKDGQIPQAMADSAVPAQMNQQRLEACMAPSPDYRATGRGPATRHAAAVSKLWGGRMIPVMAHSSTTGRFSGAALGSPETACTGVLELSGGACSEPWRNAGAFENVFCLEGAVSIRYGRDLEFAITLGRFDMASIPPGVRHAISHQGAAAAKVVMVLSMAQGGDYSAVFDAGLATDPAVTAAAVDLHLKFDSDHGIATTQETVSSRVTRFATLVPYKKDLQSTAGIPPEATMLLSAGSVCPLIVPEGHVGRSRTAPMYGPQGLYLSIAECASSADGPPAHSHSDTQETFMVIDGEWDICAGFENEFTVHAKPYDIVAMPRNVMRTFRNRGNSPARLLVIIQGPEKMDDIVSYSSALGDVIAERFGADTVDAYRRIKMTFDAEQRLSA